MLCHQHPADPAHAACQRCQRGLCRSCTKLFLQRLCTHCIEQSASRRRVEARRTLWLALPVFALAAWGTASGLPLAPRLRLYVASLAGMVALGVWFGLRRWRRAPALGSGFASLPEGETLFERALKPALAGIVFWPWLLIETLRDMQLAGRLRAFVPAENRARSFGFGEASLAIASVAAAFTLGTSGLTLDNPADAPRAHVGSLGSQASAPVARAVEAAVPEAEPIVPSVPALPVVEEPKVHEEPRGHRRKRELEVAAAEEQPAVEEPPAPEPVAEPEPEATPQQEPVRLDRRYVPGSEMAKQALSGKNGPEGYVTSSGRVVIKAPPPSP
ncbi:MAG TPA: hypothetical protein VFX59_12035 [Polyangiales bacterium]|nr:hypothetical protein [Polyangiales bacterium]